MLLIGTNMSLQKNNAITLMSKKGDFSCRKIAAPIATQIQTQLFYDGWPPNAFKFCAQEYHSNCSCTNCQRWGNLIKNGQDSTASNSMQHC